MKAIISHFGDFELDHVAQELRQGGKVIDLPVSALDCLAYLVIHRDRPVGRDEIILAVWGRPDVSETLLGQTIVRLRKVLGDSGSDQRSIRTISRKGYRWVAPTTSAERPVAAPSGDSSGGNRPRLAEGSPGRPRLPASWRRTTFAVMMAATGAVVTALAVIELSRFHQAEREPAALAGNALVLPSETDAPENWSWLRLGVMDLVANRLRQAGQPTITSEAVVGLLHGLEQPQAAGHGTWLRDRRLDATSRLRVQPSVKLSNGQWSVHLSVADGNWLLDVDARSTDVLTAATQATDLLLTKWGRTPPAAPQAPAPQGLAETVQRAKAATLAGHLDEARAVIAGAPREWASAPELAWSSALIDAYAGDYDRAREQLLGTLPRVSEEEQPVLRARMLTLLGAMYMRRAESVSAETTYAQAIKLAEGGKDVTVLAHAYAGRAVVAATRRHYEDALADFGLARALDERAGNVLGIAQTDMNIGSIMDIRGQPAVAVRTLGDAARRLQALSSQEEWAVALQSVASAQLRLLDIPGALETTAAFSPPSVDIADKRLRWSLALTRARTLAAHRQALEARTEVQAVWDAASEPADALFRSNAAEVWARLAMLDGDAKEAARLAAIALTPDMERADTLLFAHAWQLRLWGLQHSGAIDEARTLTDAYLVWLRASPTAPTEALVAFAQAEQARAEGRVGDARRAYAEAFDAAEKGGVPDDTVTIGTAFADFLLGNGEIANAASIGGRLAPWSELDPRIVELRNRLKAKEQRSDPSAS